MREYAPVLSSSSAIRSYSHCVASTITEATIIDSDVPSPARPLDTPATSEIVKSSLHVPAVAVRMIHVSAPARALLPDADSATLTSRHSAPRPVLVYPLDYLSQTPCSPYSNGTIGAWLTSPLQSGGLQRGSQRADRRCGPVARVVDRSKCVWCN